MADPSTITTGDLAAISKDRIFPTKTWVSYISATIADTSLLLKIKDMQSLPRASHYSEVFEATAGSSERPWNTNFLLTVLARVLQRQDLKLSLEPYLMLRHRFMKPTQARRFFFQCKCKLVQFFHLTRIQLESRHPCELKQITLNNRRRGRLLIGMGRMITRNPDQGIARLLNAIEKGKAMVSILTRADPQDWREALGVLGTWAPADLPSSPDTTQEGNEYDVPSSTLQSPPS
ncbi:MAG: hypothetical protein J3Q66DRAFT_394430 [Benniella sp.]|nr:MAG: hypothetical protein J3Q66DRAFT_394430 [Benniella sp.]